MTVLQAEDNCHEAQLHTLPETPLVLDAQSSMDKYHQPTLSTALFIFLQGVVSISVFTEDGKSFNLEVAFTDFLADETRAELALPAMTVEQRKEAKRLFALDFINAATFYHLYFIIITSVQWTIAATFSPNSLKRMGSLSIKVWGGLGQPAWDLAPGSGRKVQRF